MNKGNFKTDIEELEFKRKVGLPEKAKPIISHEEIYGLRDAVNDIPLCPHCGEWSYYTIDEAKRNGGYTVCPFCEGLMYMKSFFKVDHIIR